MTQTCAHVIIHDVLDMDTLISILARSIATVNKRKGDAVRTTTLMGELPCIILLYQWRPGVL